MAAGLSRDAVLLYLQSRGGSVRNAELLQRFRGYIREDPDRDRNRELFKRFVNSLATVQQVDGVSYVVLRKKFRGKTPDGVERSSGEAPGRRSEASPGTDAQSPAGGAGPPRQVAGVPGRAILPAAGMILGNSDVERRADLVQNQDQHKDQYQHQYQDKDQYQHKDQHQDQYQHQYQDKDQYQHKDQYQDKHQDQYQHQHQHQHQDQDQDQDQDQYQDQHQYQYQHQHQDQDKDQHQQSGRSEVPARPAAAQAWGLTPGPSQLPPQPQQRTRGPGPPTETTPVTRDAEQEVPVAVPSRGQIPGRPTGLIPPPETPGGRAHLQAQVSPPPETPGGRAHLQAQVSPPPETPGGRAHLQAQVSPPVQSRHRHRKSYKSAVSHDDDDEDSPVGPVSAGGQPLGSVGKAPPPPSTASPAPSSPSSSSSERKLPEIYVQDVRGDLLPPADLHWSSGSGVGAGPGPGQGCAPDRPEAEQRPLQPPASAPSRSSIFPERTGSLEELRSGAAAPVGDPGIPEQLPRSKLCETRRSSDHLHVDQEPSVWSWRRSAGHLLSDRPDSESRDGSVFSPHLRKRPAELGGVGGGLRSRMCLSLGADLDQLLQEEAGRRGAGGTEAARLNRLTLISSSLSLHRRLSTSSLSSCSTPPRCHSLSNLLEGAGRSRSPAAGAKAHDEDHARQSLVPLEAREHAWLVKGAAGAWPDIYSLFREDSSLLNRKDFISGFTVLHWIAKHGDHRVLNTLWYGVEKAGLTFDVNARSTSGHTPLHIAAIHGHKNIIRLLVRKFNADVRLRDTAGKKAWHYLGGATPLDVFQLLGAPPRAALSGQGGLGKTEAERRRRRQHLSSASPAHRSLGKTKVKRSSSLAAFLKHKSLNLYQAQRMDSPA